MNNKVFLLSPDDLKANSQLNYNVEDDMAANAIRTAQNTYLREVIGDNLLESVQDMVSGNTIGDSGNTAYKELLDVYISDYLSAKAQVEILQMLTFKLRNIGVSTDNDTNITSVDFDTMEQLRNLLETLAVDKHNRLVCFLRENKAAFPELSEGSCACGACKKNANLKLEANTNLYLGF